LSLSNKTILFAWEIGEGLGHLPPLKAVAQALKREGASVVFALRDAVQTRAELAELGAPILPAPFWPTPAPPPSPSGTYADILAGNGYGASANIRALIEAWDAVFGVTRPDLIVCEHAPSAALCAFGRIPVAFVGNGFVVPPSDAPEFPSYEPGKGEALRQRPILAAMQEALAGLGRSPPKTICEPFRGVFRGVYTFPSLDTYRGMRREPVLGPIEPLPALSALPATRRLFAYSAADYSGIDELARSLMDLGPEASAYFRGALGARAAVIKSRGVHVYDTAPSLSAILPGADAVFSHAGTGFAHAALAAGRPHIVSPRHFEALVTARRLEEMGAGIVVHPFEPKRFRDAVKRAFDDSAVRTAAQKAGEAAQEFMKTAAPLETTCAALRKILT